MKLFFFRIISVVTFFIFPTTQVYAECIVNSVSYDVGGRTGSGVTAINRSKPIDLSIIRSHASAWNNIIDDVNWNAEYDGANLDVIANNKNKQVFLKLIIQKVLT